VSSEYIDREALERGKLAANITLKGTVVNLLLVVAKLLAGIFGKSSAMIADALHSVTDFASDLFVLLGFRIANKPPDKSHHYGHGKFETLITIVVALMILLAGLLILSNALYQVYLHIQQGNVLETPGKIALIAALISIVAKELLYRATRKVGIKIKSDALIANAWHHRSDALSSVATLIGIGGAILLGERWAILDPIAAFVVSILILIVGIRMLGKGIMELMETSIGEEKEEEILSLVNSVEGAYNPHNLKTRKIGNSVAIEIHIEVDKRLKITKAHDIATEVEDTLKVRFGEETHISIHIEPYGYKE